MNLPLLPDILMHSTRVFSQVWFNAIWLAMWQGSLVLILVAAVCRVGHKLIPATRNWLWRLGLLKCLLLLFQAPLLNLAILPKARDVLGYVISSDIVADLPNWFYVKYTFGIPCLLIWVLFLVFFTGRLLQVRQRMHRLRKAAKPLEHEYIGRLTAHLGRQYGLRRIPGLYTTEQAATPMVIGWLRPIVLLPASLPVVCSPNEIAMIIGHELAHIKRRDLVWNWVPELTRLLLGINPLVLYALRELQTTQEAACDQMALAATHSSPATYGKLLLRLTAMAAPDRLQSVLAPSMNTAAGNALKQRLQSLRPSTYSKAGAWSAIILVALVALPIRLVPQRPFVADALLDSDYVNNSMATAGSSSERPGLGQPMTRSQLLVSSSEVEVRSHQYRVRIVL
jgi:beta-lactamase regulating signal transducer with metallopeptidase domain